MVGYKMDLKGDMKVKAIEASYLISLRADIVRDWEEKWGFNMFSNTAYQNASLKHNDECFDKQYRKALVKWDLLTDLIDKCDYILHKE